MTRASLSQIILSQIASPVPRVAAAIRAMPLIQKQWCLGGRALPLVPWTASKVDLHGITGEQDVDEARVLLLNFKATADMEWLSEHLRLQSRWWLLKSRKVPLLQELLKQIEAKNIGAKKAASTCKLVVSILLRDHVFLVLNDTRAPVLAFDAEEPNFASLEWFVNELASDIKCMDAAVGSSGTITTAKNSSSDTTEEDDLAKDAVAKLKQHPFCLNAWYLPSRGSFKIQRTDKNYFEVGIPDVKKLQKNARMEIGDLAWQPFETTIIQTYTKSLEVLEINNALETKKPEETRPSQKQRLLTEWGARGTKE